jgi:predicted O-methyltransferase YrrM/DNA-binding PadR family transcriptional regulator
MRDNRQDFSPLEDYRSPRWHHDPEQDPSDRRRHHGHGGHRGHGGQRGDGRHGLHSGRKLSASDLQLIILAHLADRPAHGYELIKSLGDHSHGLYVPSPGAIYPALTYLEEVGFASVEMEGTKKRYTLTEGGRSHYEQNRVAAGRILSDMERIGAQMAQARQTMESGLAPDESECGTTRENTHMELNTHAYNDYIASLFASQDAALSESIAEMERENVPGINVSAVEGKLLQILALTVGAKRILEIGTLGGYSGIYLARALPEDGKLITLEIDPHHAEVARRNFERADVGHKIEVRVGPASETLGQLTAAGEPLFDLIFIDADKDGYTEYLRLSLPLLREGGLLLGDNTLPDAVLTQETSGTKRYNAAVAQFPELTTIIIPVLRQHGMDGLTVSFKRSPPA